MNERTTAAPDHPVTVDHTDLLLALREELAPLAAVMNPERRDRLMRMRESFAKKRPGLAAWISVVVDCEGDIKQALTQISRATDVALQREAYP
jgi:hypothetical protein